MTADDHLTGRERQGRDDSWLRRTPSATRLQEVGRGLLKSSYLLYRTYREAHTRRALLRHTGRPLLVYQMGKVGSTSVVAALREALPDRHVLHVHFLSSGNLASSDAYSRRTFAGNRSIDEVFLRGRVVRRRLNALADPPPLEVITMVRDPLARNLSAFFQTLPREHPGLAESLAADPMNPGHMAEVRRVFGCSAWMANPLDWFDTELKNVTGVDVLAEPFDPALGWHVYERPAVRVLLLRQEDLARSFTPAIDAFLGVAGVTLERRNDRQQSPFAYAYRELQKEFRLGDAELDKYYDSPIARHLHSKSEIMAFRARWVGTSAPDGLERGGDSRPS